MASRTSGIRVNKGLVQFGASTSTASSGRWCLRVLNRLWAMTMSPTQAGPTTKAAVPGAEVKG